MLLAASHRERETELRPAPARRARNQRATEQLRRAAARPAAMVDRLENRRLLSVLTVTNANDVGAGSLRAAISAAGAGDTIQFASSLAGATISLTQEFQITKPIAITGLGASQLTLDATHNINNGVFQVDQTAWGTVISGLTISNAFNGVSGGAAVYAKTTVTLTDCTFSDNLGGYGLGINGGTVYFDGSYGGTLTVSGCTFAGNDCAISGAIGYSGAGGTDSLVVDHCSFYNNSAAIAASHGNTSIRDCAIASGGPNWAAISNSDGTMVITGSTISGNGSGGLRNEGSGTLTVINSTIFGNEAHKGGGIYNNSNLTVRNSTICGNSADSAGGGIYTPSWAMATLYNTIIANNYNATSPDVSGPVTAHNCLVGNTLGAQILPAIGGNNLLDQDALVAPLGSYGGSTQTMPPLLGSPAIDRGDNIYIPSGVTTDQRGLQRIFNSTVDIGACEYQGPAPDIAVSYNGQNIVDGDSTPSTADGTDFGTSASPVDRTFTVTNAGSATLTLSGLTVPSGFSIVNGLSSSLAPGASDTFTVRFLATGNASGLVSFANNDSNESPFNFLITGTLATAPEVAVSGNGQNIVDGDSTPSTADGTDFGTSASPVDRTFTVTNAGSATLTLSGLTVPSGFSIVNGLSSSLAPGASDTFTVRFLATGNASGLVSFANNDSNESPFNFLITGTLATAPEVAVSGNGQNIVDGDSTPSTTDGTDFGTSAAAVDRTFTVTNAGSATLTLSGLTVPSGFSIVNGLSSSLAPGASDTFTVRFLATGNASGLVSFANNDSNENPFNFSVVGTRLPGSNLPLAPRNLTATPFSTTRVDLSWTDRSSNEDGFWVEVRDDTAGGGWQRYKNCAQNTSSCAVRTLYDNSLYSFRVCSYTAGGASAWAQVLSVKTPDNGSLATAGDRGNAPVRPHVKDVEDRIGPADPRDYFKYRMAYAGKLKVVLDDLTAGEGVNVKLMRLNANGTTTQVGFASTATRDNPTIQTGWIAAGNYFVRVQQNSAGDATDYRLMVLADYAGESMTRAHPIVVPPGGARNGWIGDGDVQDWYRFNLGSAGKVRINLSGLSDDLDVKLLDSAGSQISRSELGGSSAEEIETSLGAGRYYIVVYAPSGESSGYRLGVGLA